MPKQTVTRPDPEQTSQRLEELRVVRYSSVAGREGMHNMVQRLWEIPTEPDSDEQLGRLGIAPLDDPELVANPMPGSDPKAKTRWLTFDAGGSVKALYVFGSAVKGNSRDGSYNVFTEILCELIERHRPRRIVMPTFDRLVRSTDHASQVWAAVRRHSDEILTAEGSFDTRVSGAEMNFFIKVLGAASDARALTLRFLDGRLTKLKEGGCLLAPSQMPFGYRQAADGRVETNPADRVIIEAILQGIASRQTPASIVASVGQLGGSSARLRALYGPNATYANACSNPSATVGNWVSWIDLWETGATEMAFACDLRNVDTYRGFELVRDARKDTCHLVVPMVWGTPTDGWAPRALFQRVRDELGSRRTTRLRGLGGAAHRSRSPLAGLASWSDDNNDWKLFSRGESYHLRRRPSTTNNRPNGGWGRGSLDSEIDGEVSARIPARLLHRSLADGIAHAIGEGVNANETAAVVDLRSEPTLESDAAECAADLRRIEAEQRHLLDSILMTESAGVRRSLISRADKMEGQIVETRRRLEALKPAGTIECDASAVISALATLATIEGPTNAQIGDALAQILRNLTLRATQDQVSWSVAVAIPTVTGTLELGPITGTLRIPSTRKRPIGIASRAAELTETLLTTPSTLLSIMEDNGFTRRDTLERAIHEHLTTLGLNRQARTLIANSRVPTSATTTLWQYLNGQSVDASHDPRWVQLVIARYKTSPPGMAPAAAFTASLPRRRRMLEHITEAGGTVDKRTLISSGIATPGMLRDAVNGIKARKNRNQRDPILERHPLRNHFVTLMPCPHCPGVANVLHMLPEVAASVICGDCRKMPTPDSPAFPADYVT